MKSLFKIIRGLSVSLPRCRLLLQSEHVSKIARTSIGFQQTTFKPHILPAASFCTTTTENESVFMTLLGVPWKTKKRDIEDFFEGIHLQDVVLEYEGNRLTGRVFVQVSESDVSKILAKHREFIGPRYIEVAEADESDRMVISDLQESKMTAEPFTTGDSVYVQLGGVPYAATKEDICEFLTGCRVEEILFDYNNYSHRKRFVYVLIPNEDVETALAKDREYIENRYIEVNLSDIDLARRTIPQLQRIAKRMQVLFDVEKSNRTYVSLMGAPYSIRLDDIRRLLGVDIEEVLIKDAMDQSSRKIMYCLIQMDDLEKVLKKNGAYVGTRYIKVEKTPSYAYDQMAFARAM